MSRAGEAAGRLDSYVEALRARGAMKEFTKAYRLRRIAAKARGEGFMSFKVAELRLRRALIPYLVGGNTLGVRSRKFSTLKGADGGFWRTRGRQHLRGSAGKSVDQLPLSFFGGKWRSRRRASKSPTSFFSWSKRLDFAAVRLASSCSASLMLGEAAPVMGLRFLGGAFVKVGPLWGRLLITFHLIRRVP
jgi:hypothetical protein